MKQLHGIHHVTAITSSAEKIYEFFTYILGMRLVKKTVNQDDIQTYHLFFADDRGSAGTDMTFFDFQGMSKAIKGTDEIAKTSFRVPNDKAIEYYKKRFEKYQVKHFQIQTLFGIKTLAFEDFDGQEYVLFSDENDRGVEPGIPWQKGPIPLEYAITGLGPVFIRVSDEKKMGQVLEDILGFEYIGKENDLLLYQTGLKGNGSSIILDTSVKGVPSRQGYGGIHHIAFRIDHKDDINDWIKRLNQIRAPHSGYVDRFYFESLYIRLYPGILFEFATEGPGFIDDEESYETLGETLALPPKFRHKRQSIETLVRHIDTKRSDKTFVKEDMGMKS